MTRTILGFTGTRAGTSPAQSAALRTLLAPLDVSEVHHGDGIGGDAAFHDAVREALPATKIVIHPSEDDANRAFCDGDDHVQALPTMRRNAAIIRRCDVLIACPGERTELKSSETWATIRKAWNRHVPVVFVYPDGGTEGSMPAS